MNCVIKDRKTFGNLAVCPVTAYDLVIWSIYDEVSTLDVAIEKEKAFSEGDIVIAGQYLGLIKEIQRDKLSATLKCEHIAKLFERELIYETGPADNLEPYLKSQIDANYTAQPDVVYRLPWLSVAVNTETASTMGPDIEDGVWNIKSYISKIRRIHNIFTTFRATRDRLVVDITRRPITTRKLDLSMPSIEILEETYSDNAVGKITSYEPEDGISQDWYLLEDGTITTEYHVEGRVAGSWEILQIRDAAETEYDVQDEFAKNTFSHKVLLSLPASGARYNFYDRVQLAHDGRLYSSYIAAIRLSSGDNRIEYQCGELRTTFTDKIQEDM